MNIQIEYTDMFCGEANYGWVKRIDAEIPDNATDRMLLRRAKKEMQLSGRQGVVSKYGDCISFKPYCSNTVLFITWEG